MSSNNWITLCKTSDLVKNSGVCAAIKTAANEPIKQVALFQVDEQQVYAICNYDPVGQANVLYRGIIGDANGDLFVASPLYKQRFRLTDGRCLDDESLSIKPYQTRIINDEVQVLAA